MRRPSFTKDKMEIFRSRFLDVFPKCEELEQDIKPKE